MAMSLDLMKPTLPAQHMAFTVPNIFSFSKGQSVSSPLQGPTGSFKYCLLIFPAGTEIASTAEGNAQPVSAFLKISPPEHLRDNWTCPDVRYSLWIKSLKRIKPPDIEYKDKNTFCKEHDDRGWHDMFKRDCLRDYVSPDGALQIMGIIHNLPYVHPPPETPKPLFPGLDFSTEARMLSFRLAEGPSLFFDQRLLMARSEYFQKMLTSDEWQESRKGEVDFTGDPHVTKQIMQAILHFILSDSFQVGSVEFNLEVRKLADRFCLKSLVEKVDAAMKDMLNEDNLLQILAEMHDTNSVVEKSCWTMLESDCNILAKHEDLLDTLIAEKPTLARKLILLGTKRRRRS